MLSEPNEALAASQDIAKSPGEVCLIKNLQVWSFEPVREEDQLYQWVSGCHLAIIISNLINRIQSNLYDDSIGTIPLLGVDTEFKKVKILVGITCNDE